MRHHPIIRLVAVSAAIWAAGALFLAKTAHSRKPVAFDPREPGARQPAGPSAVRNAGPEAMRSGDCPDWDKVDQAVDESFPTSDPPSR
jgi:hypothetical protein